jgi:hypothetical protein
MLRLVCLAGLLVRFGQPAEPAAKLEAHAPEYLVDPDTGQWYVTSCGWHGEPFGTVIPGSVAIRELDWTT